MTVGPMPDSCAGIHEVRRYLSTWTPTKSICRITYRVNSCRHKSSGFTLSRLTFNLVNTQFITTPYSGIACLSSITALCRLTTPKLDLPGVIPPTQVVESSLTIRLLIYHSSKKQFFGWDFLLPRLCFPWSSALLTCDWIHWLFPCEHQVLTSSSLALSSAYAACTDTPCARLGGVRP
jgi:hypothetical protein